MDAEAKASIVARLHRMAAEQPGQTWRLSPTNAEITTAELASADAAELDRRGADWEWLEQTTY